MSHFGMGLQAHLYSALTKNRELLDVLAGPRIYDHIPENIKPPYIAIGRTAMNDWSTATEEGFEHQVTLHIWAPPSSRNLSYQLQEIIHRTMDQLSPKLINAIIVNVTLEHSEINRERNSMYFHAISRFRIVTEVT